MRILLFAGLAEAAGQDHLVFDVPLPATAQELLDQLRVSFPQLPWQGVRLAVEQSYVAADAALPADAEFALIPPVSGG
jgi:molybdopterin converting factor small subunit